MNKYLKYILICLVPLLFFSCSKSERNDLISRGMGKLSLSLEQDLNHLLVTTKGGDEGLQFKIDILKNDVIVQTIEDHRELEDEPIILKAGTYKIVASNGEDLPAAFESPFYKGETTVEVKVGETVGATIDCALANVKASVSFSKGVTSNFSTYDVVISNGIDSLLYDKANNAKNGFFRVTGILRYHIKLINTDGVEYNISNTISNVQAREYYKLNFDIDGNSSGDQGGAAINITYDTDLDAQEHNVSINLNKRSMPTIHEASGAELDQLLMVPQGAGVLGLFNINAMAGVSEVRFIHNSPSVESMGIPYEVKIPGNVNLADKGIVWSDFQKDVSASMTLDIRTLLSEKLPLGTYSFIISVLDVEQQYVEKEISVKIIPDTEITTLSVDAWGKFAYVYAQYNTESEPDGLGFKYKKRSDSDWMTFDGTLEKDGIHFSARISGLEPNTSYDFKAVSTKDDKDENVLSATTEKTEQLPNMNMDSWCQSGDAWFPNGNMSSLFWDTANGGTADYGYVPTVPESENVISGKAAKLSTIKATVAIITKLAAGNLYTGQFGEVVMSGGGGAILNFGRPYSCRPTSFKGYVDYRPQKIGEFCDTKYMHMKGQNDHGQVFVMLTDWTEPREINTTKGNYISPDDPSVIAYSEMTFTENTNGYVEFNLPIEYRDDRKPTYILLICAASKYGDYFTGAVGSVMYVDEMSFGFD